MAKQEYWEGKGYAFFCNRKCEAFPCHEGVDEENFNCLFCYCPLYPLGENCGGKFSYTESGIKNCSACAFPHQRENYGKITARFAELAAVAAPEKERVRKQEGDEAL